MIAYLIDQIYNQDNGIITTEEFKRRQILFSESQQHFQKTNWAQNMVITNSCILLFLVVFACIRSGAFFLHTFPASFVKSWGQRDDIQLIYSPAENLNPSAYRNVPHRERFEDRPKSSIYFSGAGVYFWWQAGAAKYIQDYCDIADVKCYGASAGSITASLLLGLGKFKT